MQRLTTRNGCGSVPYISWSSDSDLHVYVEDVLMEECWTEDIDSV